MKLRTPKSHVPSRAVALLATAALVVACGPAMRQEEPSTSSAPADEAGAGAMNERASVSQGPTVSEQHYGDLEDGTPVTQVTLANGRGIEVDIINYGGIITRLTTPDASGRPGDVVLGFDSLDGYVSPAPTSARSMGRYGNRIAGGRFTLDGRRTSWRPTTATTTCTAARAGLRQEDLAAGARSSTPDRPGACS